MLHLLFLLACSTSTPTDSRVVDEDATSARSLVDTTSDLLVLDVRTPDEFAAGHLDGAVNIDVLSPDFETRVKAELDPAVPVLVHCQAGAPGGRSRKAVPVLQSAGFGEVHHLDGGYAAWTQGKNPTVR